MAISFCGPSLTFECINWIKFNGPGIWHRGMPTWMPQLSSHCAHQRERERERTVCNKNHFHRNKWCVDMERRSKQCWRIAFHLSHCFATCFYCWIPYTNLFANASLQNLLSDFLKHSGFGGCSLAANTGLSWVNGCASQRRSCGRQKLSGRIERSVSIG